MKGYIALTVAIVLLFLIMVIGVVSSFTSLSKLQQAESSNENLDKNLSLDSCVEDSLMRLNLNDSIEENFDINGNIECEVNIEDQTDNEWTYTVSNGVKEVRIVAARSDRVYILSWEAL